MTDPADEARLREAAAALADAVDAALPGWVDRCVRRHLAAPDPAAVARAGAAAVADVGARVRALLALDIDQQGANPLALLRSAVRYPTEVLGAAGVAPVERAEFDQRAFPEDPYGLTPATWSDIDPALHDPGITWGAAKAFIHLQRRKPSGGSARGGRRTGS